ncbi:MAG: phosphate signaling complex protein PhoU [Thermodesulfobacteriota bacterium]|nr:MAG: phosphate signaling complex protein PhoU [Thermodesulfobacteriota bacterium]
MAREVYHKSLKDVQNDLMKMSEMVATAISRAMEALETRDMQASKKVIKDDLRINKLRFNIEKKCMMLIATQQPMAKDLRMLGSVINIITDLERIGDHAEGIAKISVLIGDTPLVKPLIDLPRMADKAVDMLRRTMVAFMEKDVETARKICDEDDIVDALYDQIYRELLFLMIEKPKIIEGATHLIWAAHNLERIADRVTNIAERVVYMVTGKMEELNVSKY